MQASYTVTLTTVLFDAVRDWYTLCYKSIIIPLENILWWKRVIVKFNKLPLNLQLKEKHVSVAIEYFGFTSIWLHKLSSKWDVMLNVTSALWTFVWAYLIIWDLCMLLLRLKYVVKQSNKPYKRIRCHECMVKICWGNIDRQKNYHDKVYKVVLIYAVQMLIWEVSALNTKQ